MSDHYHYDYADQRHDHRGDYAEQRHDHDIDYAEKYHRHYDDESTARGLREDLGHAEARIGELENDLRDALERIHALEDRLPDYAAAEAPSDDQPCPETSDGQHCGDWHDGGRCGACGQFGPEPDGEDQAEYDPGPEVDDEGGMSEYRGWLP